VLGDREADGLILAEGLRLVDGEIEGLTEADSETEGDMEALPETEGLFEALGLLE